MLSRIPTAMIGRMTAVIGKAVSLFAARKRILFGALTSTVSVYFGR